MNKRDVIILHIINQPWVRETVGIARERRVCAEYGRIAGQLDGPAHLVARFVLRGHDNAGAGTDVLCGASVPENDVGV